MRRTTTRLGIVCCLVLVAVSLLSSSCAFLGTVRPTLKIGLVAPFEGRYRYVGYDVIYAVRLALREANEGGGVGGYGVELVAYDDGADPVMAREQARKLDVDPLVMAAMGHFREETTAAAADVYAERGLPLVVPASLRLWVEGRNVVYAPGPSAGDLAAQLVDRAAGLADAEPIALVGEGGPLASALREAAAERDLTLHPMTQVGDGPTERILSLDPGVLLCDLDPVPAGELVAALRRSRWQGAVLGGPRLGMGDFAAVAGPAAAGATFVTPWPFPDDVPGGDAFVADYTDVSGGTMPGPLALPAYRATWILLEALERAAESGPPTRGRVGEALSAFQSEGLLAGPAQEGVHGALQLGLSWYRIGPDGIPQLIGPAASTDGRVLSRALAEPGGEPGP